MKPLLTIFAILLLTLASCEPAASSFTLLSDTAFYSIPLPRKGPDVPDFSPRVIARDSMHTVHILKFEPSETGNTYEILTYDSSRKQLLERHFEPGQTQEMDISGLAPGKYWMSAMAIAEAVTFEVEIR